METTSSETESYSDSSRSTTSLRSSKRKRHSSWSPTRGVGQSEKMVSSWTKKLAEKYFHIRYHDEELFIEDVLSKGIEFNQQLSAEQQDHLTKLKEYLAFNLNDEDLTSLRWESRTLKVIDDMKQKLSLQKVQWDKRYTVVKFLDSLRAFPRHRKKIPENYYLEIFGRFAEMCLLSVDFHPETIRWKGLKGIKVASKSDLKLHPFGFAETRSQTSVCIIEAKKYLELLNTQSGSTSAVVDGMYGQHVGELLVNLFHLPKEKFENVPVLSMAGLVVNGTKVQFTMLTISKDHYRKLVDNKELAETDQAFIYTSSFYDILCQHQRNEVMNALISLNNIDQEIS